MTHDSISKQTFNPTDSQRHTMTMNTLINEGRPFDYDAITALLSPPLDITNLGNPGQFKDVKVGIIGGGLAGLSAAFELRKLGFDITIFEAQKDHIGGRVYTYYFDKDKKLYGELGAMRIPVSHETSWHYINLFKLDTIPFIESNHNTFAYIRGVRSNNTPSSIMSNIYSRFSLTPSECATPWPDLYKQLSRAALSSIPINVRPELLQILPVYSPEFEQFTTVSMRQMLGLYGFSPGAISLITSLLPAINAELYNSYEEELIEDYGLNLTNLYQIPGGMTKLPLALYKSLTSKYPAEYADIPPSALGKFTWKPGQWVTGIYKKSTEEKVTLSYTDTTEYTSANELFDYVICTLPLSELRKVDVRPFFSDKKMQAIREVNYEDAQKTIFLCSEPFFEKGNASQRITGGSSVTDLVIESIVYPSNSENPNRQAVFIASYNAGLDAIRLGTTDSKKRFILIKRQVEEVHGLPQGYLDKIVTAFKTVDWNKKHWSSGAYARFLPGQRKDFFYELSVPEYDNRVFFAGEHTSPSHAWMQGALHSGMLSANNLVICHRQFHLH